MGAYRFNLPDIGEGLSEGEIVRWHAELGAPVTADAVLVEVETDKAVVEIPAPVSGVVSEFGGNPGDIVPVGNLLAVIETEGEIKAVAPKEASATPSPAPTPRVAAPVAPAGPATTTPSDAAPKRVLAAPATRKLAVELGVDLAAVAGSGPRGQITRADVEGAAQAPAAKPALAAPVQAPAAPARPEGEDRVVALRGLRRQVAKSMTEAWQNIPHVFDFRDVDASELVKARQSLQDEVADGGPRITYLPLFVKAVVATLKRHPSFNATIDLAREEIIHRHRYNIGVATATPDGLIVPVIHDADTKSVFELAAEIERLAEATRERKVSLADLGQGTFTISNFGSYGGVRGTPIIRPPEVAIAGFGRIHEAVVPVDGAPAVRRILPVVASFDHRVNDGAEIGAFISSLAGYLSQPLRLLGSL